MTRQKDDDNTIPGRKIIGVHNQALIGNDDIERYGCWCGCECLYACACPCVFITSHLCYFDPIAYICKCECEQLISMVFSVQRWRAQRANFTKSLQRAACTCGAIVFGESHAGMPLCVCVCVFMCGYARTLCKSTYTRTQSCAIPAAHARVCVKRCWCMPRIICFSEKAAQICVWTTYTDASMERLSSSTHNSRYQC